jgi:integrase/recombinase XerD
MTNTDFDWQIDEFMVYCRSTQLREKTMASYEQTLRLFERWCREQLNIDYVDKVTEAVIRRYINDLQERGKYSFYSNDKGKEKNFPDRRRDFRKPISVCTINNYIRNLRVFFNWMDLEGTIRKNPMKKVRQLKDNRKAKEYISDEDFKKLIKSMDKSYFSEHRDFAMIVLMFDTGMRLAECSRLLVSDLDMYGHKIHLREEETKGRKGRTVYFSPKTERVLRRWLQFKDRYTETDYVFPSKRDGSPVEVTGFETNFTRYLNRFGIAEKVSPHCLRNNFAKRCLMNGMDLYSLSRILGHSSVTVTEQAYLDLNDDDLGMRYQNFAPMRKIK